MSDERGPEYEALVDEVSRLRQRLAQAQDPETAERWERERAAWAAEYADNQAIHQARIDIAKETVARAHSAADFIRNAAASIVTLYTGVLGITSALDRGEEGLFPARGILPAIFLSGAIIGATAYVALIQKPKPLQLPKPHSSLPELQERRLSSLVDWLADITLRRAYALHAAVISLAMGTAFLPAPFLQVLDDSQWISAAAVAAVITLALPYFTTRVVLNIETPRLKASAGFAAITLVLAYLIVWTGLAQGEVVSWIVWLLGATLIAVLLTRGLRLQGAARTAGLIALLVIAFSVLQTSYDLTSYITLAGDCRDAEVSDAVYRGETSSNGAPVYDLPDRNSQEKMRFPASCTAGFDAFCVGQPQLSPRTNVPDGRWFILSGSRRVVSAADISGTPPRTLEAVTCEGGKEAPGPVSLIAPKSPNLTGRTTVRATNDDGLAIGFLIGRSSQNGMDWDRIGFDPDPSDGSTVSWTPDMAGSGQVAISAVVCLALSVPSEAVATKAFTIGSDKVAPAIELAKPTPRAREASCNIAPESDVASSTTTAQPGGCDPAYPDTCLRVGIGDYDCTGGTRNGPNYIKGPIRVLPPDPFELDTDNDGNGCE